MFENDEARHALAELGLSISPHSDPAYGWGYTWLHRDWVGPFTTPVAALHAAFTEALLALQFRSDYSWILFSEPGELRRYDGEREGWTHVSAVAAKNVFDALAFRTIVQAVAQMKDYPTHFAEGEPFPYCPFCRGFGLFATGNGGIAHRTDCPVALAARLSATYGIETSATEQDAILVRGMYYEVAKIADIVMTPERAIQFSYISPTGKLQQSIVAPEQDGYDEIKKVLDTWPHRQRKQSIKNAEQELRELASALDTDLPGDAGYVERLTAVADFLETLQL